MSYIFSSESITGGHPDKIAVQISDVILDATLSGDQDYLGIPQKVPFKPEHYRYLRKGLKGTMNIESTI